MLSTFVQHPVPTEELTELRIIAQFDFIYVQEYISLLLNSQFKLASLCI